MAATGYEIKAILPPASSLPYGLLINVMRDLVVPASPHGPHNTNRWQLGVKFRPKGCGSISGSANDCAPQIKNVRDFPDHYVQPSFMLIDGLQCSTLSADLDEMNAELGENLTVLLSAALASELVSGALSGGLSLSNSATAPVALPFGSPALGIDVALAALEEELARRLHGQRGMIFVSPGTLVKLVVLGAVRWSESENSYLSPSGHFVIGDAGFVDMDGPGGTPAPAGQDWMYASGMVHGVVGEITFLGDGQDNLDRTRNNLIQIAERPSVLVFDPCTVTAVLACYGCSPCAGA